MPKPKKTTTSARELAELGLANVDTTKSKAPAYRRNRRKDELLAILRKNNGIVSVACEKVGISRATFYEWRQKDPKFDDAVHEINERTLDFVEAKLIDGIRAGNPKLIIFYLVNRGRSRGSSRKPEDLNPEPGTAEANANAVELARQHLEALGVAPPGLPLEELARLVAARVAESPEGSA